MKKVEKIGELRFCLDDYRDSIYNESIDLTYSLYGSESDEILSLDIFRGYCRQFAAAMGYSEKTINEVFGEW